LVKRIYETDMKFWAVFWAVGAAERKNSQLPQVCNFLGGYFNFLWANSFYYYFSKNVLASALKSYSA
jgi:hypothetical protein